jgi:hypothetical protein
MSSTGQPTNVSYNFRLIINALDDYAQLTGIDLSKDPFAEKIQLSTSSDDILKLLQQREMAFREYRHANRRLINCLSPAVRVLHAFSGYLGEAVNVVRHICLIPLRVSALTLQCYLASFLSVPQKPSLSALMFFSLYVRPFETNICQIS